MYLAADGTFNFSFLINATSNMCLCHADLLQRWKHQHFCFKLLTGFKIVSITITILFGIHSLESLLLAGIIIIIFFVIMSGMMRHEKIKLHLCMTMESV